MSIVPVVVPVEPKLIAAARNSGCLKTAALGLVEAYGVSGDTKADYANLLGVEANFDRLLSASQTGSLIACQDALWARNSLSLRPLGVLEGQAICLEKMARKAHQSATTLTGTLIAGQLLERSYVNSTVLESEEREAAQLPPEERRGYHSTFGFSKKPEFLSRRDELGVELMTAIVGQDPDLGSRLARSLYDRTNVSPEVKSQAWLGYATAMNVCQQHGNWTLLEILAENALEKLGLPKRETHFARSKLRCAQIKLGHAPETQQALGTLLGTGDIDMPLSVTLADTTAGKVEVVLV